MTSIYDFKIFKLITILTSKYYFKIYIYIYTYRENYSTLRILTIRIFFREFKLGKRRRVKAAEGINLAFEESYVNVRIDSTFSPFSPFLSIYIDRVQN